MKNKIYIHGSREVLIPGGGEVLIPFGAFFGYEKTRDLPLCGTATRCGIATPLQTPPATHPIPTQRPTHPTTSENGN